MEYLRIRSKLLFISIIPLLFVIALSSIVLYEVYNDKRNLDLTKNRILEAKALSTVIHYMQIERGLTSGLIAADNLDANNTRLAAVKEKLDKAIRSAKNSYSKVTQSNNSYIAEILEKILNRDGTELLRMPIRDARKYYTKNIAELLNFVKTIPTMMDDKENRNFIQAYGSLASAKEALGQTRATLVEVFEVNMLVEDVFIATKEQLKEYNSNIQNFRIITPKKLRNYYEQTFSGAVVEETFQIIEAALQNRNGQGFHLEPRYWFKIATESINLLKKVEDELFSCVGKLIKKKQDFVHYKMAILLLFLIFSAIVITVLMFQSIRKILSSANTLEKEYDDSLLLLEQYKSTVDRSFIVSKTDSHGVITYVNDEFCKISGYSKEELLGQSHNIIKHPDMDPEIFKEMWYTIKVLKKPWIGEIKNRKKDGSYYWLKAIINPILDSGGNVEEYIGIRIDISQQKEMADYFHNQLKISVENFNCSLHLSKEYEKAMDTSTILSRIDTEGKITYANETFLNITGYKLDEIVGKNHRILSIESQESEKIYAKIWDTISKGNIWRGILKNRTKFQKDFWAKTIIVPIKDLYGNIIEYLVIRNDITELIEQRKEFERIAKTDPLTGCGNRFRLNNDMRELEGLSVAIFNIDNFRQINDFYGHQFGDLIIKSISDKIYTQIVQDKDLRFYRLQGDEFIALATCFSKEKLIQRVKNILDVIREKFTIQNEEMLVSCSCGISFEDKEHLLSTANMALKVAKKSNTDYVIYDTSISLNHQYENNIYWTRKLANAIKEESIVTYYQPIINNNTLINEKYECLVRMQDGEKVISPFFFLDIAKQTRQYFEITKTVIYQAFEMFKDKEVEFSINLSIQDIFEDQIFEYLMMMLQKYDIGERVVFEIVESEYIENFEGVIDFIDKLREYRCKIAIDDFGTGYSNFEYLIRLKADYLKIDGSLIKNIDKDDNAYLVVSTIVDFAKKLGMKTVAEFVENEEIFKIVKELGIDYSQGYYFSAAKKDPE